jgi:NitT/TauT family transport system substrate-binding protein
MNKQKAGRGFSVQNLRGLATGQAATRTIAMPAALLVAFLSFGAQAAEPMHLILSPGNAARAQPLYAEKTGIFKTLGLTTEMIRDMNGEATMKALDEDKCDIGYANIVSIAVAADRGKSYVILSLGSIYTSETAYTILVQAATSDFKTGKDLEGKTVATPFPDDLGQLGVKAWIDKTGGDSSKVKFVHRIPLSEVETALLEHRVDASETTEPQWTQQRERGKLKLLAKNFDALAPRFVNGGFIAKREWVAAHPEEAKRFREAMHQAARWAHAHRDEAIALFAEEMKVPNSVVAARAGAGFAEEMTPDLVQPVLDAAVRYGMIKPVRAETLFAQP